jgi:hypothetical protein
MGDFNFGHQVYYINIAQSFGKVLVKFSIQKFIQCASRIFWGNVFSVLLPVGWALWK